MIWCVGEPRRELLQRRVTAPRCGWSSHHGDSSRSLPKQALRLCAGSAQRRRSLRSSRRSPRSSRLSSRRSERRLTPCATTATVPTVAAVRATGLGPTTPGRPIRRAARGMLDFSFCGCQLLGVLVGCFFLLISFDGGEQRLNGDAATGYQLAARPTYGRRERRRPGVLPH
jgi:hypothetical protein